MLDSIFAVKRPSNFVKSVVALFFTFQQYPMSLYFSLYCNSMLVPKLFSLKMGLLCSSE
jgi:hypothetical protein